MGKTTAGRFRFRQRGSAQRLTPLDGTPFLQSLRGRLILAAAFVSLLIFGLLLLEARASLSEAEALATERAFSSARFVASVQASSIEAGEQFLLTLSRLEVVRDREAVACNVLFADLLQQFPNYGNLGVADAEGTLWCSGLPFTGTVTFTDRAWFWDVTGNLRFTVGDYLIGRVSGIPSMNLSYPVVSEAGELQDVVWGGLSLRWFNRAIDGTTLPPGSTVTVIDSNGTVMARYPEGERWLGQTTHDAVNVLDLLHEHAEGTYRGVGFDGVERLYAFMPLSPLTPDTTIRVGIPTEVVFSEAVRDFQQSLLVFVLVSLLVFALIWFGSGSLFLRKIDALLVATRRLGQGDLSVRSGLAGEKSEFGELARSFDSTALALSEAQKQAQEREEELKHLAASLQASNDELSSFSYAVSHDLRSPLSGIDGFSQALLEDYGHVLDDTGRHYLTRIRANTRRMSQLIDDLLMLSRVSRKELKVEPVDLCALAEDIAKELQERYPHQPEFRCDVKATVEGDAGLLRIALTNLLDNAWKYTGEREGASIHFGASQEPDGLVFYLRDNGAGFDAAYAHQLFQPFQRLHGSFGGMGVGLATVRRVIERHGGRIWTESKAGEGATFFFSLNETA